MVKYNHRRVLIFMGMKKGQKQYGLCFTDEIFRLRGLGLSRKQIGEHLGVEMAP